ncbi:MAG TPA: hypothetical protein VEZ49_05985 [Gemmatimonadales bacterium]|nr:hypothetical protein [Gemmatimonadales bacterium]
MGFIPEWALGVGVVIIAVSIGRAVSFMVRAPSRSSQASSEEIGELRQALDEMQHRVGELEERVDFAERRLGSAPR